MKPNLKNMKKILFVILALSMSLTLSAQKRDVIYMKNGSVIRGQITEIADSKVKISTKDGSVFVYDMTEIDRMEKEEKAPAFDLRTKSDKVWNFGVTAGYMYSSNMWITKIGNTKSNQFSDNKGKHGFLVGGVAEYRPLDGFGLEFGLNFAKDGYYYGKNNKRFWYDIDRYTVNIPVAATFYMGAQRKWYLQAGVSAGINVAGKVSASEQLTMEDMSVGKILNPFNAGILLGVGWGPLGLRIHSELTPTLSKEYRDFLSEKMTFTGTAFNGSLGASLSYTYKF